MPRLHTWKNTYLDGTFRGVELRWGPIAVSFVLTPYDWRFDVTGSRPYDDGRIFPRGSGVA
jgi:hypothetical protein